MAHKHMERCSILLTIREMQIETTMRYHLSTVKMAIIRISTINAEEDMEKMKPLYTVSDNVN